MPACLCNQAEFNCFCCIQFKEVVRVKFSILNYRDVLNDDKWYIGWWRFTFIYLFRAEIDRLDYL